MSTSIFDTKPYQKDIIIILHQYTTLSINYLYTNDYDIYIISNLNIFDKYLRKKLSQNTRGKVTVITLLGDTEEFIHAIAFLNSFDNIDGRLQNKNQFAEEYTYYLKKMQYGEDISGYRLGDEEFNLPPGHCDIPLPFELIVVLDNIELNNDHLSLKSVFMQQILRFVSLKHGGTFVCTSNTQAIITSEKVLLNFLLQIGHQSTKTQRIQVNNPEAIAIYESDHNLNDKNLRICLLSPKGWDSWNKIQILATSVIHDTDKSKYNLLSNENAFNELNLVYNAYIDFSNLYVDQETTEHRTADEYKSDLFLLLSTDYKSMKITHDTQRKQGISLEEVLEKLQ